MESIKINDRLFSEYISEERLKDILHGCISEIKKDLSGINGIVVLGVLNGGVPFLNEIVFSFDRNILIDYVKVASYGDGTFSSGKTELLLDTQFDLSKRTVLIVDDIFDTGNTVRFLRDHIRKKGAENVYAACLFYKKNTDHRTLKPDYYGIEIGDDFIIGFGLDYAQRGRNLKEIYRINQ